jgi:glycerophosphoryl diester phosphodiesterase
MSFSNRALQGVHKLAPKLPLVYLVDATMPALTWDGSLPKGVHAVGLDVRLLRRPKVVRAFQRRGHQVYVWTVDSDDDVDRCLELGVDVIITNRPGHVLHRVGRSG